MRRCRLGGESGLGGMLDGGARRSSVLLLFGGGLGRVVVVVGGGEGGAGLGWRRFGFGFPFLGRGAVGFRFGVCGCGGGSRGFLFPDGVFAVGCSSGQGNGSFGKLFAFGLIIGVWGIPGGGMIILVDSTNFTLGGWGRGSGFLRLFGCCPLFPLLGDFFLFFYIPFSSFLRLFSSFIWSSNHVRLFLNTRHNRSRSPSYGDVRDLRPVKKHVGAIPLSLTPPMLEQPCVREFLRVSMGADGEGGYFVQGLV